MKYKNRAIIALLAAMLLAAGIVALAMGYAVERRASGGEVRITEICAKNESVLTDNNGKYRDYIELYATKQSINLKGYTLTDGKNTSPPLGDITIEEGAYWVLFLDKKTTGFTLNAAGGDTIRLLSPEGKVVAQAKTIAMEKDQAMIYHQGSYVLTDQPTPNFPNTAEGLLAFRSGMAEESPKLIISEVLTANKSTLPDELGVFSDVVELRNVSQEAVYLGSFFLSDDANNRFAYRLPDMVLEADSCLVIYCDGENYISDAGHIHANFGLSRGEKLYLTGRTGSFQTAPWESVGEDVSWQLSEGGEYTAGVPSLGFANTQAGIQQAMDQRTNWESPLVVSEVSLSTSGIPYGGVISDFVEITNRSEESVSTEGWYLSDGADPYAYPLPSQILQSGEVLVIRCDDTGAGFGLAPGETALLIGPDYRYAPSAVCAETEPGKTMQAYPGDLQQPWFVDEPTLGYPNTEQGRKSYLDAWQGQILRISEVMARNESYLPGPYGYCCGWIELYNAGSQKVKLKDYSLCFLNQAWEQYPMPDIVLEPGQYTVVLVDNSGQPTRKGYPTISGEISGYGVYLSREGKLEDYAILPDILPDTSFGLSHDSAQPAVLSQPTPGSANAPAAAPSDAPVALTAPGAYDGVEYLDIVLQGPGKLYYTTNCTLPDQSSTPYTGPVRITKTTIFRVVCYEPGKDASQVVDLSYFLNENDDLSVVSLVTEPDNLFSPSTGIYVSGYNALPTSPYTGANFWQDWERSATVTLIDTDGSVAFSQGCGIKIFGAYSRMNEKKSFACMFRARYGAGRLEYPVFGEDSLPYYESLVLRAGGQDIYHARMRDEMITSLAGEYLGLPVQDYRPVALYLNGQFWGVYYIREKLSDQYVAGHYNMNAQDVTLCQASGTGLREYVEVTRYARTHNLAQQEHFDYIASRVDLENYTDYMIAQLWINNTDSSNVKFFLNNEGKWTWALFDTDMSFSSPAVNTIRQQLKSPGDDVICRTLLIRLLMNDAYRDYFLERAAWQVNNLWTQENINSRIDEIYGLIRHDMRKDTQRWNKSYEHWENSVEHLRSFAERRNSYFVGHIKSYFHLTWEEMGEYGFPLPED